METTTRKATNPDTGEEEQIEFPTVEEIRQVILILEHPSEGIIVKELVKELANYFNLSDEQKAARMNDEGKSNIFYHMVMSAINVLKKRGIVEQPGRNRTPYFLVEEDPPDEDLTPDEDVSPEDVPTDDPPDIENINQRIRKKLALDLLEEIKRKSPSFFEKLVLDLLLKMGYGESREDAGEVTGGPGDGGIDGIIYQDKLGLEVVGFQAKLRTTGNRISPSVINEFVGALRLKGLNKGVIITTTGFSRNARISAEGSDNPKIALIDGERLAQLMIDHNVGVSTVDTYEIKRVDSDYFDEIT